MHAVGRVVLTAISLYERYILETKYDVLTPEDKVNALRYEGGIRNTFVDCIRVNRDFQTILEYECAEKMKLIVNMESPAEIRYDKISSDQYLVKSFKYSDAFYRVLYVKKHESSEVINAPGHGDTDKESYSTEEERLCKKERLDLEAERRAAERLKLRTESGSTPLFANGGDDAKKRKKRKEAGPPKPPQQKTIIARRARFGKWMEKLRSKPAENNGNNVGEVAEPITDMGVEEKCGHDEEDGGSESEDAERNEPCPYDAAFDRYGYGDCGNLVVQGTRTAMDSTVQEEEAELEEDQFLNGIINMSDEVRQLRQARGRKSYYNMEVKHTGRTTGVEIKFMSDCKQLRHEPLISTKSALQDASVEIDRAEELDSACSGSTESDVAEGSAPILDVHSDGRSGGSEETSVQGTARTGSV